MFMQPLNHIYENCLFFRNIVAEKFTIILKIKHKLIVKMFSKQIELGINPRKKMIYKQMKCYMKFAVTYSKLIINLAFCQLKQVNNTPNDI